MSFLFKFSSTLVLWLPTRNSERYTLGVNGPSNGTAVNECLFTPGSTQNVIQPQTHLLLKHSMGTRSYG